MLQVKIVEWTLEHVVELLYVCTVAIGSLRVVVELHDLTVEITTSVDLSCIVSDYQEDGVKYTWEVIQIRVCIEPSQ